MNFKKISISQSRKMFKGFINHEMHTLANENAVDYCAKVVKLTIEFDKSCKKSEISMNPDGWMVSPMDRQHDYENFLATLLMSKVIRSPALVVRAFNVEVARAQDLTTDPQTAELRLQFWRNTLTTFYDKNNDNVTVPANPVAQELFKIICTYKLPKRNLEKLVISRSNLLRTKFFKSLEDLEKYSEDAVSSIYYILLGIAGIKDLYADHAASHLGKAQGITNMLRSIHISNMQKVVSLPMDVLMKHQVSQETILRGVDSGQVRNVVFDIACRADTHLKKARNIGVPKVANQVFLPAIAIDNYLKKLQKCEFNIFAKPLQLGNPILPINLYINRLLNKY